MKDQEVIQRVEKRVEEKLGFYIHLSAYIVVNLLLIALNLSTSPEAYWFQWPLFGWGIGVILHGLSVFVFGAGSAIRKRLIDAEMKKEGAKS